jgi:hypothetical protein
MAESGISMRRGFAIALLPIALYLVIYELFLVPSPLKDISTDSQYAPAIGKRFSASSRLLAISVTLDRNYANHVDYALLIPPPGFKGPEVLSIEELPEGTAFEVIGIMKSASILYKVEVVGRAHGIAPVVVRKTGAIEDGNYGLDKTAFVLMELKK